MIYLSLLFFLVSSVSSQRSGSQFCYPIVWQDCPPGQRCEEGICQPDSTCSLFCTLDPDNQCQNGQCVRRPGASCSDRNLPCSSGYSCQQGICSRDSTCSLFCTLDPDNQCQNGQCVRRPGASCWDHNLPCSSGYSCQQGICSLDSTCSLFCTLDPDNRCENGQCVRRPGASCWDHNLPCSSGYSCQQGICSLAGDTCPRNCRDYPGSICENGRCVWRPLAQCDGIEYLPCSSGYVCRNGFCQRDRECSSDSVCPDSHRYECVNGKCELYRSCRSIFDCSGVQRCHRRRCREPCGISGICQKPGFKCESGVCVPIQDGLIIPTSSPTPTAPSGIGCRNNFECPPGQECIRIGSQRQCVFVIS